MSTIGTSSGNKTIAAIVVGTASGNKAVQVGYVGTSGGNKVFFSALGASMSPGGQTSGGALPGHTFSTETATAVGGIGPFTYLWSLSGTSGGTWSIATPTLQTVTPQVSGVASSTTAFATLTCTITDSSTGLSAPTSASLDYNRA